MRMLANIGIGLVLWLGFAWIFGHIKFTPGMSNTLGTVTDKLGIAGDEAIEDFYLEVTIVLSLVLSIGVLWVVNLAFFRRHRAAPVGGQGSL